jgi:CRP/FNR family transcriptional regulator
MHSRNGLEVVDNCLNCHLQKERFFCCFSQQALQAFNAIKLTNLYPRSTVLFVEGQTPRGIFVLCQGRVKLSICSRDGKMLIVHIAEPGDVLGLSAVMSNMPFELTAEALETSQLDFVKRDDFLGFLKQHSEAYLKVAQYLSQHYYQAYLRIRALCLSNTAAEKLARLLLEWCEVNGKATEHGIQLKLALTHEEIAEIIGTSRETVSRLLSQFKHNHIMQQTGTSLLIQDATKLEAIFRP